MTLERYRFPGPLQQFRNELDRLFGEFGLGRFRPARMGSDVFPAVNVWDEGERYCVEAEVPGVTKEALEIYALGNELTIKGKRPQPASENRVFHRQERGTGEFTRVVALPGEVNPDQIDAVLEEGVLMLRLAKAAAALPKKIQVKAG
jgi:HSP20 family protein